MKRKRWAGAAIAACLAASAHAAELARWDDQTLYAQEVVDAALVDSVTFNVVQQGMVGIGLALRAWTYPPHSPGMGDFWATLTDLSTGAQLAANGNSFFDDAGGIYVINPLQLRVGQYRADLGFQMPGAGVAEIDVLSNLSPYAVLTPVREVPEPASVALLCIGLPWLRFTRCRRT